MSRYKNKKPVKKKKQLSLEEAILQRTPYKVKFRTFDYWRVDSPYKAKLHKIDIDAQLFLAQFEAEEVNGWIVKNIPSIYNDEFLANKLTEIKANPLEYEEFLERKAYFEKKHKKKFSELRFTRDEILRANNTDVPHRRQDSCSRARFDPDKYSKVSEEFGISPNEINETIMTTSPADKHGIENEDINRSRDAIRNNELEIFTYEKLVEIIDELKFINNELKYFSDELLSDLSSIYNWYLETKIDKTSFYIFQYFTIRAIKELPYDIGELKKEILRLEQVFEQIVYPKIVVNGKITNKSIKVKKELRKSTKEKSND